MYKENREERSGEKALCCDTFYNKNISPRGYDDTTPACDVGLSHVIGLNGSEFRKGHSLLLVQDLNLIPDSV